MPKEPLLHKLQLSYPVCLVLWQAELVAKVPATEGGTEQHPQGAGRGAGRKDVHVSLHPHRRQHLGAHGAGQNIYVYKAPARPVQPLMFHQAVNSVQFLELTLKPLIHINEA